MDKELIESLIRKIVVQELEKINGGCNRQVDPSGVMSFNIDNMKLDKFPFEIGTDKVWLKDLVSLEESPRLGFGIMEMDNTAFEWTLTYDEVDYVIEGTLEIIIDGRKVTAGPGEILYIPKNTHISFSTPNKTKFMYVCYPANWSEQSN